MIPGGMAGLGLIILGLGGTIAFELTDRHSPQAGLPGGPAPLATAGARDRAIPGQSEIDGRLTGILARPIFSPDRRPAGAGAKSVSGLSRLTGIVVTDTRRIAIFAGPPGGQPVAVEEGAHVNAYEVTAINGAGVTLVGPNGTTVVTPIFDAATPSAAKRPLPAPPEPARAARK